MNFTIKQLIVSNGIERGYATNNWIFEPEGHPDSTQQVPAHISFCTADGHMALTEGIAYVMNARGETVGKYHLGFAKDHAAKAQTQ